MRKSVDAAEFVRRLINVRGCVCVFICVFREGARLHLQQGDAGGIDLSLGGKGTVWMWV